MVPIILLIRSLSSPPLQNAPDISIRRRLLRPQLLIHSYSFSVFQPTIPQVNSKMYLRRYVRRQLKQNLPATRMCPIDVSPPPLPLAPLPSLPNHLFLVLIKDDPGSWYPPAVPPLSTRPDAPDTSLPSYAVVGGHDRK